MNQSGVGTGPTHFGGKVKESKILKEEGVL